MDKLVYLTLGKGKIVYVKVNDDYLKYDINNNDWVFATTYVMDAIVGFDDSEPVGSPYRYGNGSCMLDINYISKDDADKLIGFIINEDDVIKKYNNR